MCFVVCRGQKISRVNLLPFGLLNQSCQTSKESAICHFRVCGSTTAMSSLVSMILSKTPLRTTQVDHGVLLGRCVHPFFLHGVQVDGWTDVSWWETPGGGRQGQQVPLNFFFLWCPRAHVNTASGRQSSAHVESTVLPLNLHSSCKTTWQGRMNYVSVTL